MQMQFNTKEQQKPNKEMKLRIYSKIYAQKGTGGARHAVEKHLLFVGGGVAHGPKGAVYKIKKINKKVRKIGLSC